MAGTNMDTHTGGPGLGVDWDMSVCHERWTPAVCLPLPVSFVRTAWCSSG